MTCISLAQCHTGDDLLGSPPPQCLTETPKSTDILILIFLHNISLKSNSDFCKTCLFHMLVKNVAAQYIADTCCLWLSLWSIDHYQWGIPAEGFFSACFAHMQTHLYMYNSYFMSYNILKLWPTFLLQSFCKKALKVT